MTPVAQEKIVVLGDGLHTSIVGKAKLLLLEFGEYRPTSFYVRHESGPGCILGYPFLAKYNVLIDCCNKQLLL